MTKFHLHRSPDSDQIIEAITNSHRRDICGGIYQTEFHLMVNFLRYLQLAKSLAEPQLRIIAYRRN
jgi:hypothetical protein